ncbi:glycosyltransferase [Micromonospora wenchangensis]|uniref:glycosyltransferase n=1 Tax=Micromonospora wenchangensis TaxID=1185415 RepID=UPI003800E0EC
MPLLNIAAHCNVRIVVEIGRSDSDQPNLPDNMRAVRLRASEILIKRSTAVLTTGGSSATLSALTHARPLILAPTGGEQRVTAEVCNAWGVGVEWPDNPSQLFNDLQRPDHEARGHARRIANILNTELGLTKAVAVLERLCASQTRN